MLDIGKYPYDTGVSFIAVIVDNKITGIHDLMVMFKEDFKDDLGMMPLLCCARSCKL